MRYPFFILVFFLSMPVFAEDFGSAFPTPYSPSPYGSTYYPSTTAVQSMDSDFYAGWENEHENRLENAGISAFDSASELSTLQTWDTTYAYDCPKNSNTCLGRFKGSAKNTFGMDMNISIEGRTAYDIETHQLHIEQLKVYVPKGTAIDGHALKLGLESDFTHFIRSRYND